MEICGLGIAIKDCANTMKKKEPSDSLMPIQDSRFPGFLVLKRERMGGFGLAVIKG